MKRLFTFDDVLIEPHVSNVESRRNVRLNTRLGKIKLRIPIISANMETITETQMAASMQLAGGLGIIHRFCNVRDNVGMVNFMNDAAATSGVKPQYGVSIGIGDRGKDRAEQLYEAGARIFCIDVAHGAQKQVVKQARWLSDNDIDNDLEIIVGNFATSKQINWFVDQTQSDRFIFKVGIGPGSVCSTRIKTGVGVPQLYAIQECVDNSYDVDIIADGGMRYPGDVCVTGNTRILTSDLRWVEAKDIKKGQKLVSFEEFPSKLKKSGEKGKRKFRTGTVSENKKQILSCMEIVTDKGKVTVSKDHKWLVRTTKGNKFFWKATEDLKLTDKIVYLGKPWKTNESLDRSYLKGFMDGEGYLTRTRNSCILGFSQAIGETATFAKNIMKKLCSSVKFYEKTRYKTKHKKQISVCVFGFYNQMKLLGEIRSQRLLNKAHKVWENVDVTNMEMATILSVKDVGERETFTVTTDYKTFIAEGFLSHNCKALAVGAKAVMLGGMLAGTDETPGDRTWAGKTGREGQIIIDKWEKEYSGSATTGYGQGWRTSEGVVRAVECKGPVKNILGDIEGGLRSALTYVGAKNLRDFKQKSNLIFISNSSRTENTPHLKVGE